MSDAGGAQIFRALPGDSRWVRGRVVRQKGWLLLGGLGKAKERAAQRQRQTERERETEPASVCSIAFSSIAVLLDSLVSFHGGRV